MDIIDDTINLTERKAWKDAYHIAWVGACNSKAVARTIEHHATLIGIDHPAVAAMRGHQEFLHGKSLGPSFDLLNQVIENARKFGWA